MRAVAEGTRVLARACACGLHPFFSPLKRVCVWGGGGDIPVRSSGIAPPPAPLLRLSETSPPFCACACVGVSPCHCRVNEVVSQLAGPGDQHLDPGNCGAVVNERLAGSGGDGSPPFTGALARNPRSRRSHTQNSSSCKREDEEC